MKINLLKFGFIISNLANTVGFSTTGSSLNLRQGRSIQNLPLKATYPINPEGNYTNPEDFDREGELSKSQLKGLTYGLTEEEVQAPNFGLITKAIEALVKGGLKTYRETYDKIKDFNDPQLIGLKYGLTEEEVRTPNFGLPTIIAINFLTDDGTRTIWEAFNLIKGLNEDEVKGVYHFNLTKEQVENPSFNEDIIEIMMELQVVIPKAEGAHLYETAMKMKPYQIRGVLEYGLSLPRVGIGILDNKFVQQKPKDSNFSEETIKTLEFLSTHNLGYSKQDAYNIAINLSLNQVKDILLYGRPWQKVLNPYQFRNKRLKNLIKNKPLHIRGPYFKLTKKQLRNAKKGFNELFKKDAYNIETSPTPLSDVSTIPEDSLNLYKLVALTNTTYQEPEASSSTSKGAKKSNNKKNMGGKGNNDKRGNNKKKGKNGKKRKPKP